jgi:DNA-binding transcriptional MerR regulator
MSVRTEERIFRIGEVAEQVGVTTRTIRYYEELGLLGAHASRTKGTHRLYNEGDVARLRELIRFRDLLGLSLEDLVELADTEEARAVLCDEWFAEPTDVDRLRIIEQAIPLAERQLALVHGRQETLEHFAAELKAKLVSLRDRRRELQRSLQ